LEQVIATIEQQDLDGLRAEWRRRYGAPPRLRSTLLLRHVLAWRIQADVHGSLDEQTRKLLRDTRMPHDPVVGEGTILTREWKGVHHQVEATDGGFLYDGRRWKSLSEIARAITGTRWNGRRFFGLNGTAK
jgi:hypothetical protein